jgi:hypothetical protein
MKKYGSLNIKNKESMFLASCPKFKETLEFKDAINLYYSRQAFALQNTIPSL